MKNNKKIINTFMDRCKFILPPPQVQDIAE